jgi:hypothetical protein
LWEVAWADRTGSGWRSRARAAAATRRSRRTLDVFLRFLLEKRDEYEVEKVFEVRLAEEPLDLS